ncbi:MAG: NADH-quinone oxidoreductase subunit NuoK [Nitrospinota bacterium]|nr:NADH-quinone oxidoreductase subunit NuoK [Nitrospinota bacterium]
MIMMNNYLLLSAALFVIGAVGVLIRRNLIVVMMCIELMLNAANLNFITFANYHHKMSGHVFVFMVIAVAAAEAAVGLAVALALFRNRETVDVDEVDSMKG